jgi:hypothetical protein
MGAFGGPTLQKNKKKKKVKDIFRTCGLKILFFGISVSFCFTDSIWVLEKY